MPFRPLAGSLCVEIGSDPSAAFGARLLADLGAEVIKVEPPGQGDEMRHESPCASTNGHAASALFAYLNYGKRSVALDTATTEGLALLDSLVRRSDVVIVSPRTAGRLPALLEPSGRDDPARPTLIAVSPHGVVGPRAGQPSSPFVVQHAAGFAFHQASPVADPESTPPIAGADVEGALAVGIVVANAALWALRGGEQGTPRPFVDIAAEDVFAYLLVEPFADWREGRDPAERRRDPGTPSMVAGGLVWLLPCADGAVMVSPREDHQWDRWVEVMGRPAWVEDASICGDRGIRARNATAIGQKMSAWSIDQRCADVFAQAQARRVACFPVSTPRDMIANAQLRDRGFYGRLRVAPDVVIPAPGLPFALRTTGGAVLERGGEVAAPALGEGNGEVLHGSTRPAPPRESAWLQQGVA